MNSSVLHSPKASFSKLKLEKLINLTLNEATKLYCTKKFLYFQMENLLNL